jgi:MFS transporter, DHA2 family, multidrug resistance protein
MAAVSQNATDATHAVPTHKWLVALAVMLGTSLEALDTSIVNVALPHMQGAFSASVDEIAWVFTSYLVANGIMIPMTAWISSRFGRKRYFLTSVFTFVAASTLCGAAQSLGQMICFRLIQGAAGAAMIPSSQAILMETFPSDEREIAMAIWGMGLMVSPILGPTLGGWITDNWNWRWNFYINVPIGCIAFPMVLAFVHDPPYMRESRTQKGRVDYLGILLLVVSLGVLQIVLDRGQRADWFNSPWVVYATALSALAFVSLVMRELRFGRPILDLRILKLRVFDAALAVTITFSAVLFGTILLSPIFLQELLGYSASKAGLVQAPRGMGSMFSMMIVGNIARWGVDTTRFIGLGFTLIAIGCWYSSRFNLQIGIWQIIWPTMVMGFGFGMIFPPTSAAAISCVPRERMGYAASLYNMMRNTGASVGIAWMTNILISQQQIHQSRLVEHFSVFDAWRLTNGGQGLPGGPSFSYLPQLITGQKQSLGMVYGAIQAQSAMLSFNDIYRILTVMSLIMIPSFLLLRGARSTGDVSAH